MIEALNPVDGVHNVRHTLEDEYFPPPRNIRDLLGAIENFARLGFAAPSENIKFVDKDIDASEMLESLNLILKFDKNYALYDFSAKRV